MPPLDTTGFGPAALVLAAGLALGTPFVTSTETDKAKALREAGSQGGQFVSHPPSTQPMPPGGGTQRVPAASDSSSEILTPGILHAEQNGWVRIHRSENGGIQIDVLSPTTGEPTRSTFFIPRDDVPPGIQTAAENGWVRLVPTGTRWLQVDSIDPMSGLGTRLVEDQSVSAKPKEWDYTNVLTPGFLTAEENGWARVNRGDGFVLIDIMDPTTGGVQQTFQFVHESALSPGLQTAVDNGWARLVPVGGGWVRVELLDPQTGEVMKLPFGPKGGVPAPPKSKGVVNKF